MRKTQYYSDMTKIWFCITFNFYNREVMKQQHYMTTIVELCKPRFVMHPLQNPPLRSSTEKLSHNVSARIWATHYQRKENRKTAYYDDYLKPFLITCSGLYSTGTMYHLPTKWSPIYLPVLLVSACLYLSALHQTLAFNN